jgi:hypothetical protein
LVLEKLTVTQVVKKFLDLRNKKYTTVCHLDPIPCQFNPIFTITFSKILFYCNTPNGLLPANLLTKILNIFLISLIHGASHQYMLKLTTCPLSNTLIIVLILGNSDVPCVMVLQLLNVLLGGKINVLIMDVPLN